MRAVKMMARRYVVFDMLFSGFRRKFTSRFPDVPKLVGFAARFTG